MRLEDFDRDNDSDSFFLLHIITPQHSTRFLAEKKLVERLRSFAQEIEVLDDCRSNLFLREDDTINL